MRWENGAVDIDTANFGRSRPGAEGYDKDEVDQFVEEVKEALRHEPPSMAPWEVRDKVFRTQRVHRGYDEHDVDDFLDQAEKALRAAHGEGFSDPHEDVRPRHSHPLVVGAVLLALIVAVVAALIQWA
jgi:DivIVA domain-containing protein